MLEKFYTRKAVIALMALILAANGLLLYQFQIKPPTETANTPSSGGSPGVPDTPREEEETETPAEEEDDSERDSERSEPEEDGDAEDTEDAEDAPQDSAEGSPGEEPPPRGAAPPETPFESQYGSPTTTPGSDDLSQIQVALASFYNSGVGGANGSGETSILPTTSGVGLLPPAMLVVAVVVGAVTIAAIRRR